MHLFRRPSGLLLILVALLTVPFAAVAWEDPCPEVEAREAFSWRPAKLAAPSVIVSKTPAQTPSQTPSQAARTPLPSSPPVRTSVRVLTGRLNQ
jgi:hypothetical protein